jgi:hypothetical protein
MVERVWKSPAWLNSSTVLVCDEKFRSPKRSTIGSDYDFHGYSLQIDRFKQMGVRVETGIMTNCSYTNTVATS